MNPVIPPRPDVSYVGVTTKPPQPGERHERGRSDTAHRREPPPIPPHPVDNDWEAREQMRMREVEEARARAAQMEKTMRWWSDCTANWREKWSKVRNERNKAREECRTLRSKLEAAVKETTLLRRERSELTSEVDSLGKQLDLYRNSEKEHTSLASSTGTGSQKSGGDPDSADNQDSAEQRTSDNEPGIEPSTSGNNITGDDFSFVDKLLSKKEKEGDTASNVSEKIDKMRQMKKMYEEALTQEDSLSEEKISHLQLKLEEAQKTVLVEREEKNQQTQTIEKLQTELTSIKVKYDELKRSNHIAVQELDKMREIHQDELGRMTLDLEEESHSRYSMDRRLADLRKELERLQAENAQEWGKRERLETEKLALERENKKLHSQIEDLEENMEKKTQLTSAMLDGDMRILQQEVAEKTKELNDLRHAHTKLKKVLQEKATDLEHAKRRADQYELEVKKLRGRIEELKKDLGFAEDEADRQANQVRKLQRTNDELQEQNENLQVQVEHLQTRLRRANPSMKARSSSLKSFDPNESTEASDDDTED